MNLYILTHEGSYVGGTLIVAADTFAQLPEIIWVEYRKTGTIKRGIVGPGYTYGNVWNSPYDHLFTDARMENDVRYRTKLIDLRTNKEDDPDDNYLFLARVIENVPIDVYGIISATYHDG